MGKSFQQSLPLYFVLLSLLACGIKRESPVHFSRVQYEKGAIVRGDTSRREIALVFTADTYGEGGEYVRQVLRQHNQRASFFFTGNFYRNADFAPLIYDLIGDGHYLGAHSDRHLLYCDWQNRDSLLVSRETFTADLLANYREMKRFGIRSEQAPYFLPPYEWYNDSISHWTAEAGFELINFSRGTRSHADYTTPAMPGYTDSQTIWQSILEYEERDPAGLNGFILLSHIGTAPERQDKFYFYLDTLLATLSERGYRFRRIDDLLGLE